jgi:hypothetical protein
MVLCPVLRIVGTLLANRRAFGGILLFVVSLGWGVAGIL